MIRIQTDLGIQEELSEAFSFYANNYQHMPAYRDTPWDGKIRLFNRNTGELNAGLYPRLVKWCEQRNYDIELIKTKFGLPFQNEEPIDVEYLYNFIKKLGLPWEVKDYQFRAIYRSLNDRRLVVKSPTGSGKSLIIYVIIAYYLAHYKEMGKLLVVVPTVGLVKQMFSDFKEYGMPAEKFCHQIFAGQEKGRIQKPVIISTWQSIYKKPSSWFNKFGCVVGDECHQFKAKCLSSIMNKSKKAAFRVGTTGTLDGEEVNQLTLEGLFGPVLQTTTTSKLQKDNILAELDIKMIELKHPRNILPAVKKVEYQHEIDAIVTRDRRNQYIVDLATSLEGNTLVLFNYIDKQGESLDAKFKRRDLEAYYYIHGNVKHNDREYVRKLVDKKNNAVVLASYGVFSTGINIRNIHNIIFASPYKSQVRVLQSIGRGLRLSDNGMHTTLYDLFDVFESYKGYSYYHAARRQEIYRKEKFRYRVFQISLL